MSGSDSRDKDSVTEVAGGAFIRERPPEIERGTVLAGRYQIEDVIGKGGSGVVLRVFDRVAQNVVALKVLKTELARDAKWEKRFSRELRLGRPIQHPNVCRIFDIGEADGYRFLTMELAGGGSLRDEIRRKRASERPLDEKVTDAKGVIDGLAALHSAGVVHRDFKPDNILRMADGRLVLSDFGLATDAANAPGATVLIGTPHYMAPEVLAGEPATSRSDVWALGVVLHEILFGQRPERKSVSFDGSGRAPLRPTSSRERSILALCERCLADVPLDRPPDAVAVARMFERSSLAEGRRRKPRFGRGIAYLVATVVLASLAGLALRHRRSTTRTPAVSAIANVTRLKPSGEPADWSKAGRVAATVPGQIHCFSVVDGQTARVIWGKPRRAEDIDLTSGQRRPAKLEPEVYRADCPLLSSDGRRLLFTETNQAGVTEIRISNRSDGRDSRAITTGSEPLWFGNADEVVYSLGSGHAAILSLPTMEFTLLADPPFGERRVLVGKAVNRSGTLVALLFGSDQFEFAVAIYEAPKFDHPRMYSLPVGVRIQFGDDDHLLISYPLSGGESALADLDWKRGEYRNVGLYPGFDLVAVQFAEAQEVVWLRHRTSDAWLYEHQQRVRLTFDGKTYSGARSAFGDLLISRRDSNGNVNVWLQSRGGQLVRRTSGKGDVGPAFSPDGTQWLYADYEQKSVMLCATSGQECRLLQRDDSLPTWPRFSPDGRYVAYITQVGAPRLVVISVSDGRMVASWDAYYECPPVWSATDTIWSLEMSGGHYLWSERQVKDWTKTGKQFETSNENVALGEVQCWPKGVRDDSPFFQRVRIEPDEMSRLVVMPR